MAEPARPLPSLDDPATGPFWRAVRGRRLDFQHCPECDYVRWPPAPVCPECLRPGGDWRPVEPLGTVWSYAVYEHCFHPAFAAEIPYVVALVELDAGPRMIAGLSVAPEDARVGERVRAAFEDVGDVTLVRFEPNPRGG